jgi:PAS domain S-box-containing protein
MVDPAFTRLSASEDIFRALLEATNSAIIFVGTDGVVSYANRGVRDFFGLEPSSLIGRQRAEFVRGELMHLAAAPESLAARLLLPEDGSREMVVEDITLVRPTHRILERYSAPVGKADGTLHGRIDVFSDVTVGRTLQRNKDDFLSLVSHELKTPVTSIKGYAQLLRRRAEREHPPESTTVAYDVIERQAHKMQELIDVLLDLSRLETGKLALQLEVFDLRALVERVAALVRLTAEEHSIAVDLPAHPVWLRGDERRIEQVVTNLLSNSIRFSPGGGTTRVGMIPAHDRVKIIVADEGIGISPEAQQHIFERFYRAVDLSESTGMGIGLYITRGIVEQHGGTIEVDSQAGQGATFTVTLPLDGAGTMPP